MHLIQNRVFKSLLLIGFNVYSLHGWSCPSYLNTTSIYFGSDQAQGQLCHWSDRYSESLRSLNARGVDGLKIADVRAPRFVTSKDWEGQKAKLKYNPLYIYDRPGQTKGSAWSGWSKTADLVDTEAQKNFDEYLISAQNGQMPGTFRFDLIKKALEWQNSALGTAEANIAGFLRDGVLYGRAFDRNNAPTLAELQNLKNTNYPSHEVGWGPSIVKWQDTECLENMSEEIKKEFSDGSRFLPFEKLPKKQSLFIDERTNPPQTRSCGYFIYPRVFEIEQQLKDLEKDITQGINQFRAQKGSIDPIKLAARAQKWFVAIHPFKGGNGRTSRLLMDYVLQTLGLPAPLIENVDLDLTSTEDQWAVEIAKGIKQTILRLEKCAQQPNLTQCKTVN